MDSETCWFCVVFKYGFAVALGFAAGIAWMLFKG